MAKNMFNASFEESNNLVTEKYIQSCETNSTTKVISKRTLGIIVTLLFGVGAYYFSIFLESYSLETSVGEVVLLPTIFGNMWHILALIVFLGYIVNLIRYRNRRLLSSFSFTQAMTCSAFLFGVLVLLLMISIANIVMASSFPTVVYLIITVILVYSQVINYDKSIRKALYSEEIYSNKFLSFFEKFSKIARRYGSIAVICLFFLNRFFNKKVQGLEDDSMIKQAAGFLAPAMALIGLVAIFYLAQEIMQGYYLNKYYEDYRELYDGSKKVWYGPKSKEYREAVANGEEE